MMAQGSPFSVMVQPSRQVTSPGMSVAYTVVVTSSGSFSSPVTLSYAAINLPRAISGEFVPTVTVMPSPGGSAYAVLVIHVGHSTPAGLYTLTISGSGGGYGYATTITLDVTNRATFIVSVSPISQAIGVGHDKQYQITVTSLGSFSGEVDLSVMTPPFGISYTIDTPAVYLPAGGSATAMLDVSVSLDMPLGDYALVIRGSTPTCSFLWCYYWIDGCFPIRDDVHYAFAVVQVSSIMSFQVTVSPSAQSVMIDHVAFFTVQVTSLGGFASDVQLNLNQVPPGVEYAFNPAVVHPTANNPGTSTLTVKPLTSALKGTYNMDVTATSDGNTQVTTMDLTIMPITTQLYLSTPFTAVKRGDTFTVTGSISPIFAGAPINVIYTRPTGTVFMITVQTGADGTFSSQYTPTTVDLIGPWTVRAEYSGSPVYVGSSTPTQNFQVVEKGFLDQYGLLWAADYTLWIILWIIIVVGIIVAAIIGVPKLFPPRPPVPFVPPPAVVSVPVPVVQQVYQPVPVPYYYPTPPTSHSWAGYWWHGAFYHSHCRCCGRPLLVASDMTNYCPGCNQYQPKMC